MQKQQSVGDRLRCGCCTLWWPAGADNLGQAAAGDVDTRRAQTGVVPAAAGGGAPPELLARLPQPQQLLGGRLAQPAGRRGRREKRILIEVAGAGGGAARGVHARRGHKTEQQQRRRGVRGMVLLQLLCRDRLQPMNNSWPPACSSQHRSCSARLCVPALASH